MQGTKYINMHKRNVQKETDTIRKTRARQERLDEISGKIERAKHKSMRTSYHEKLKVLNDLTTIHRVFEPLYVIQEDQEGLVNGTMQKTENCADETTATVAKLPRLLRRAQSERTTTETIRMEPKMSQCLGGKMPLKNNSNSQENPENRKLLRPRSYSWSPNSPCSEPVQTRCAFQSKREYIAKLRSAAEEPCVSDSMSTVTMGYLAFKRVLRNKRRPENMARQSLDSRFRSMSLDETELSAIPELTEERDADILGECIAQTSSPTVNKDEKLKLGFSRYRQAPDRKRRLCSTLSWPSAELPKGPSERSPGLIPNGRRLRLKEVKNVNLLLKQRSPLEKVRTESGADEEEETLETCFVNPKQKIKISQNRHNRFNGTFKLLKPMGTGCFSGSFEAITQ